MITKRPDAIEVHHRQGIGRGGMSPVQGLGVVQHRLLKGLLHRGARQVHRGQVEHAVGGAAVGRFVEVLEGQLQIPSLALRTAEHEKSQFSLS